MGLWVSEKVPGVVGRTVNDKGDFINCSLSVGVKPHHNKLFRGGTTVSDVWWRLPLMTFLVGSCFPSVEIFRQKLSSETLTLFHTCIFTFLLTVDNRLTHVVSGRSESSIRVHRDFAPCHIQACRCYRHWKMALSVIFVFHPRHCFSDKDDDVGAVVDVHEQRQQAPEAATLFATSYDL